MARAHSLRIRASSEEMQHWHALACAAGMALSDLVRLSLGHVRPWSPGQASLSVERTRQIVAIGNNLNQIARRVNASRHPDRVRILGELAAIEELLAGLLPEREPEW